MPTQANSKSYWLHFENVSQISLLFTNFTVLTLLNPLSLTWVVEITSKMDFAHISPHSIFLKEWPFKNANKIIHFLPSKPGNCFPLQWGQISNILTESRSIPRKFTSACLFSLISYPSSHHLFCVTYPGVSAGPQMTKNHPASASLQLCFPADLQ